jgi:hypothetical protein
MAMLDNAVLKDINSRKWWPLRPLSIGCADGTLAAFARRSKSSCYRCA